MLLSLNLTLFRVDLLLSFSLNLFLFLPLPPDARILDLTLGLVLLGLGVLLNVVVGFLLGLEEGLGLFTTLDLVGLGGLLGLCVLIWGLLGLALWVGGGAAVEVEEKNWGGGAGVVGSNSSISSMNSGLPWPLPRPPSKMDKRVELKVGEGVVTGGGWGLNDGGSGLLVGNLLNPPPKAPGSSF